MRAELALSPGTLYGFLLVLTRISGALVFVPLPGVKAAAEPARVALSAGIALALFGHGPSVDPTVTPVRLAAWVATEAAVGIAIGVSVAIALETFVFGAQVLGLQAGYAYASTIDPNTEADSGVLLVFSQMTAGLLFFVCGLDRQVLRLFVDSLDAVPAGMYLFDRHSAEALIRLGTIVFSVGVRLALPVVALLLMVDVTLALLGRLNQQLQLLSLAFPAKMLIALAVLSWVVSLCPRLLFEACGHSWTAARRILGM